MDYHSLIEHVSNGSQRVYAVPFPYIKQADVYAYRIPADSSQPPIAISFTWQDPNTIQLSTPVANGLTLRIQRQTLRSSLLVTFKDVALMAGKHLDLSQTQLLYLIQEANDGMLLNGATLRDVAAELQELQAEDERLAGLIDSYWRENQAAHNALQSAINSESAERKAADAQLGTRIEAARAEAAAAVAAVQSAVNSKADATDVAALRASVTSQLNTLRNEVDGKMPKAPATGGPYLGKGNQWVPQSLEIGDPFVTDSDSYAVLVDRPAYLANAVWNIGQDYLTISDAAIPGDADSLFKVDADGYLVLV